MDFAFEPRAIADLASDDALRILRLNALGSLYNFIKVVLGRHKLTRHLHWGVCQDLEREHLKDLYEMPRGHYKSTICSEGLPMWKALPFSQQDEDDFIRIWNAPPEFIRWMRRTHDQDTRLLLISENITNASKLGSRIRWHFESNSLFRELFPEILPDSSCVWTNYSLHVKRKVNISGGGHGEGTFDFIGVGSALQSRHYTGGIIQDDLVGRKAIKSPVVMDDTIQYHQLVVGAFEDADPDHEGNELVVGNRWGFHDLNSHIREHEPWFRITSHSAMGGCCSEHPPDTPIFPEEFSKEKLAMFKRRQGAYQYSCFAEGTPILMSDFSEKNIEDLDIGDEIVGYTTFGKYPHLTKAYVEFTNCRDAFAVRVTTKSGRSFICTPDHKFLKRFHRERGYYGELFIGFDLCSVYVPRAKPDLAHQRMLDWLGGIFDGEGTCNEHGAVFISQSPTVNPEAHSMIGEVLKELDLTYSFTPSSDQFIVHHSRSFKIWLLSNALMAKTGRFIKSMWTKSGRVTEDGGFDPVVSAEPLGIRSVYNIQSSTGNYVAAGFATKNCQYLNNPISPEDADFKESWLNYFTLETDKLGASVIRHEVKNGVVKPDVYVGHLATAMTTDPNHSGQQGRARHAIIVIAQAEKGETYLLDSWALACSYEKYFDQLYAMAKKWKMRKVGFETIAAQKYAAYHIEYRNQFETFPIRITPLKGEVESEDGTITTKKEFRIRNIISPIAERGQLFVQRSQTDFIGEFSTFPRGKFVDMLDAFAYAPQLLRPGRGYQSNAIALAQNLKRAREVNHPYAVQ